MNGITLRAALLLAFASPCAAAAQPQEQGGIYVMQYASTDGNSGRYAVVVETIQDRMLRLATSLGGARGAGRQLTVHRRPDEVAGSQAALLGRWRSRRALALMWGRIDGEAITSSIYIGELGRPPHDMIELAVINIQARRDDELRDTHSLVAGYALLQDAIRRGAPRDRIAAIVATLTNVVNNMRGTGFRTQEVRQISAEISAIGQRLRGR